MSDTTKPFHMQETDDASPKTSSSDSRREEQYIYIGTIHVEPKISELILSFFLLYSNLNSFLSKTMRNMSL